MALHPAFLVKKSAPALPEVSAEWTCQQSGDCCTKPKEVVMTVEEMRELGRALLAKQYNPKLEFRDVGDNFVAMKAGPCPLFAFNTCIVYESRPYNCRRFACMRPDPAAEPWRFTPNGDCANLWDRLRTSRVARRLGTLIQRRAQTWAVRHGWVIDGRPK